MVFKCYYNIIETRKPYISKKLQNSMTLKIGLEIHGYIDAKEKLFCRCSTRYDNNTINKNICPICTGYPGAKPMLPNKEALEKVIKIALMLNCSVNSDKAIVWQRKHYDWPDLPKGYQNTMSGSYSVPVGERGRFLNIGIREIHLEEDPAAWDPQTGCVDYNRSGLPLVEIVTEPDFNNVEYLEEWLKNLVIALSYLKALNKKLGIKADVNVSSGGERVEIKNLNSVSNIIAAVKYEEQRQKKEKVERETRRFDDKKGITIKMRSKELAEDYRFIPDPDLPIVKISKKHVSELKSNIPDSPMEKLEKLKKKHKLDDKSARILAKNLEIVEFFEHVAHETDIKLARDWVIIELLRVLNWNKKTLDEVNIQEQHFVELLNLIKENKLTPLKAKQILNEFIPKSFSPKEKLKEATRITDKDEIKKFCQQAIKNNKKAAEDYKQGKKESLNFLLGEVMKLSKRRADFKIAKDVLVEMLKD